MDEVKSKTHRQLLYVFSYIYILHFKILDVYATIQIIIEIKYQARDKEGKENLPRKKEERECSVLKS